MLRQEGADEGSRGGGGNASPPGPPAKLKAFTRVRAHFSPGSKVMPRRIDYGHRTCRVKQVNTRWEDRNGNCKILHPRVTVTDSGDVFQRCHREKDLTWLLEKVRMVGLGRGERSIRTQARVSIVASERPARPGVMARKVRRSIRTGAEQAFL